MGLGNNPLSLPNQVSKLQFGQTFSYCLVDMQSDKTASSKLFFGSPPQGTIQINGTMQTTQMVKANSSYGLNIQNISIGGELVDIPDEAWDFSKGGGAIIDSGATLAYLVESAYSPIIKALDKSLSNFNRPTIGPDSATFELCYGSKEFNYSAVPEMVIGFADGARFTVPGTSYVIDVDADTKCLAFTMSGSGPSLIGNMLQQKNLWEFNIEKSQLSFGSSSCI
ncbi:hypothetical protein CASFOL_040561 [Castilleja foliolosa]|uniref:Peptidase A1 domain-containing protein n=1 Tax=Castilleja foliolosa TaxID=1961234 RepID=A0ABD3BBZ8_9LAMI